MDDYIIFPDDKTMEKLAAEYSKIKAKTFSAPAEILEVTDSDKAPDDKNSNYASPNIYFLLTLISAVILKSTNLK